MTASVERAPLMWLFGLASAAFIAALVLGRVERSLDLAEGSPEAAVAAYVEALVGGDEDAARRLLAPAELSDVLVPSCTHLSDFDMPPDRSFFEGEDISVALRSVSISGDVADVSVTTEIGARHAIFDAGWSSDATFRLRLLEVSGVEGWRIIRVPWPFEVCR